ncbi:MAG: hypothetical protein U0Q22_03445 [Acidimicrobiales bacterium]
MDSTLLIGIAVVAFGTALGAFMMFGQRANPLAETSGASGTIQAHSTTAPPMLTSPSASEAGLTGVRYDVRIRWYQRVRSGLILLLITVGLGMAIGAVIGSVALVVSLLMG